MTKPETIMETRAEEFLQRAIPDADGALLEVLAAEFQAIHDEASTPAAPPGLRECPFCRSTKVRHSGAAKIVVCGNCDAIGPQRAEDPTAAWNTRPQGVTTVGEAEARELLRLVLPMAKGYAHANPVGSNQQYITDAEEFIAAQGEAK